MASPLRNHGDQAVRTPSSVHVQGAGVETGTTSEIEACFQEFEKLLGFELPFRGMQSPAKRSQHAGNESLRQLTYLFFNDKSALTPLREKLSKILPTVDTPEKKLNCLAAALQRLAIKNGSNSRENQTNPSSSGRKRNALDADLFEAPSSPTLSIKHLPKNLSAEIPPLALQMLPPARPALQPVPLSAKTSFTTNASTSFATNGIKSFSSTAESDPEIIALTPSTEYGEELDDEALDVVPLEMPPPKMKFVLDDNSAKVTDSVDPPIPFELSKKPLQSEDYRVRNIAFIPPREEIDWHASVPFSLRVECQRAVQAGLKKEILESKLSSLRTPDDLRELIKAQAIDHHVQEEVDPANMTLSAKLRWGTTKKDEILKLELMPARRETANALQRKFGSDRILYVEVPVLSKLPNCLGISGQAGSFLKRVHALLYRDLNYLGYTWRHFHSSSKAKKKVRDNEFSGPGTSTWMFFAVKSSSPAIPLQELSIVDLIDWALPLRENCDQKACKAAARLDLVISRPHVTVYISPAEINYDVPDILPVDVSDATPYDDQNIDPNAFNPPFQLFKEVMNDGCNVISPWLMEKIRLKYGLPYMPSAVQLRLFGSKGVWFLESGEIPKEKPEKLISISKSQIKVVQKKQQFGPDFDLESCSVNVVNWARPLEPSFLYRDFMPILVDRGVPEENILRFARAMCKSEMDEFVSASVDRFQLDRWIEAQPTLKSDLREERKTDTNEELVLLMSRSSFEPTVNKPLANEVVKLAERVFKQNWKKLQVKIPQSTLAIGIADPTGVLQPGEIFLQFSQIFKDEASGRRWSNLHLMDVLVTRNPALRSSDIQKVRAIFVPELSHRVDVVVFPSVGKRPLASKLQGGDYDGDTFWICWQPELVEPFRNAPAPTTADILPPEQCHVDVNKTTLRDILHIQDGKEISEDEVNDWVISRTRRGMDFNLLGEVTLLYDKVVYHDGSLNSPRARALADLHDHLVDSDKRGYEFDKEKFKEFKKEHGLKDTFSKPAYREYLKSESGEVAHEMEYKKGNILDRLVYEVFLPELKEGLRRAKKALKLPDKTCRQDYRDVSLSKLYDDYTKQIRHDAAKSELVELARKIKFMNHDWWNCTTSSRNNDKGLMTDTTPRSRESWKQHKAKIAKCRETFDSIQPDDPNDLLVQEWTRETGCAPSTWTLLKASAAAKFCAQTGSGYMIYLVIRDELCRLKSRTGKRSVEVASDSYVTLKSRNVKPRLEAGDGDRMVLDVNDSSDEADDTGDDETDYGDDGGFSQVIEETALMAGL